MMPNHDVLWVVLFYSPRSKIGGDLKMGKLKAELKEMKLSQLPSSSCRGGRYAAVGLVL